MDTRRARRCSSCRAKINAGDECLKFKRERCVRGDIEERIYGDYVPLAPIYICEECGEIWLNLTDIGYCLAPDKDMRDAMREYHYMTGFDPKRYVKR